MKWAPLALLGWTTEGDRSVWSDLQSGRAGFLVRVGLSVAAAGAMLGLALTLAGLIEMSGRPISDELMAIVVAMAVIGWGAMLYWMWSGYGRWTRTLRTAFAVLAVWGLVVPTTVILDQMLGRAELLIGACIVLALGATILLITVSAYTSRGGREMIDASGAILVNCPKCGYSLVGLTSCHCPECGSKFTIDQVIAAQSYAALRDVGPSPQIADAPSRSQTVCEIPA